MTDEKKKKIERLELGPGEVDLDLDLPKGKTLHRPVSLRMFGKIYKSKPMLIPLVEKLVALQEKAEAGDQRALVEQVTLVFGVPKEIVLKKDLREIGVIGKLVTKMMVESELYRSVTEKNGDGPGEPNSA